MTSLAERMFDGWSAESELRDSLCDLVPYDRLGWDEYDCSLEIHGVPPAFRLPVEAQRLIHAAGFHKAFVNHEDKWETHYSFKPNEEFKESKGWRVSYPHNRGENEAGIWLEEIATSWPKEWFETGYCVVVTAPRSDPNAEASELSPDR